MFDANGIEIKTGMVVEVTGAYFKKNNGLFFVFRNFLSGTKKRNMVEHGGTRKAAAASLLGSGSAQM